MARKEQTFTATVGRDAGRQYLLREMPAAQGEKWAVRAILALCRSGVQMPAGYELMGMEGFSSLILAMGVRGIMTMQYADAEPLLDEMMGCVRFIPEGGTAASAIPLHDEGHIEEVQTRVQLRNEVVALHVGFSLAEKLRTLEESARMTRASTPNTSGSRTRSGRSSRAAKPRSAT